MNRLIVAILAASLAGCGSDGASGGVSVSGENNIVSIVDISDSSFECSGVLVRWFRLNDEGEPDELIASDCTEPDERENCDQCFTSLEELALLGYKSSEGCVEDLVLKGVCGDSTAIAQAQSSEGE